MRIYTEQAQAWRCVRETGRVVLKDGEKMFTHAEDVAAILADPALRRMGCPVAAAGDEQPPWLADYGRDLLGQAMRPRKARVWVAQFRPACEYLVDIIAARGGCEAMSTVVPHSVDIMRRILFGVDPEHVGEGGAINLGAVIAARRQGPRGDLVSELIRLAPVLTDAELLQLAGGVARPLSSVGQVLGAALFELGLDPVLAGGLLGDPFAIRVFVEEMVRLAPICEPRIALADTRIGDVDVAAGERIMVAHSAANRAADGGDDINQRVRKHWGFGAGRHRCRGNHLVRAILCVVLETWLSRVPGFRVPPGFTPTFQSHEEMWFEELPLTWAA